MDQKETFHWSMKAKTCFFSRDRIPMLAESNKEQQAHCLFFSNLFNLSFYMGFIQQWTLPQSPSGGHLWAPGAICPTCILILCILCIIFFIYQDSGKLKWQRVQLTLSYHSCSFWTLIRLCSLAHKLTELSKANIPASWKNLMLQKTRALWRSYFNNQRTNIISSSLKTISEIYFSSTYKK